MPVAHNVLDFIFRSLHASEDCLKERTDKIAQEHYAASKELIERADSLSKFLDDQKKQRLKVCCDYVTTINQLNMIPEM